MRWKVIGGVGNRRRACEQRSQNEAHHLAPSPQRNPGSQRRLASLAHPWQTMLVAGDESERCCKRHLKTWMYDRLRSKHENTQGGHCYASKGQRLAIDKNSD